MRKKDIRNKILLLAMMLAFFPACQTYKDNYPVPDASIPAAFSFTSRTGFDVPDTVDFINETYIPPEVTATVNYLWDFGDSTTSTEENPTHVYTGEGTFSVTLTPVSSAPNRVISAEAKVRLVKQLRGDTLLVEDFNDINVFPDDWALFNLDGGTPATSQSAYQNLKDSAFIIWYSNYWESRVAVGTSWYTDDQLDADDWMITPAITPGDNTTLQWEAMSMTTSGNYPDSYRVYVSTTTQDPAGCKSRPPLLRVNDEEVGEDVGGLGRQSRKIDLSKFSGQQIYVGFQLSTSAPGGDRLAIENILVIDL